MFSMNLKVESKRKFSDLEDGSLVEIISEDKELNGKIVVKTSGIFTKGDPHLEEVQAVMIGKPGHWNSFDCEFKELRTGDKILVQ